MILRITPYLLLVIIKILYVLNCVCGFWEAALFVDLIPFLVGGLKFSAKKLIKIRRQGLKLFYPCLYLLEKRLVQMLMLAKIFCRRHGKVIIIMVYGCYYGYYYRDIRYPLFSYPLIFQSKLWNDMFSINKSANQLYSWQRKNSYSCWNCKNLIFHARAALGFVNKSMTLILEGIWASSNIFFKFLWASFPRGSSSTTNKSNCQTSDIQYPLQLVCFLCLLQ